jgi:hypothetical protein
MFEAEAFFNVTCLQTAVKKLEKLGCFKSAQKSFNCIKLVPSFTKMVFASVRLNI